MTTRVVGCLAEVRSSLLRLPANDDVLRAVKHADQGLFQSRPAAELIPRFAELPDLARRQFDADRISSFEGAGHIVHDLPARSDGRSVSLESRPWRLDPIPFVLDSAEFEMLRPGVVARMQMLEVILADLHGARRLLTDRVIESEALWSSSRYRTATSVRTRQNAG